MVENARIRISKKNKDNLKLILDQLNGPLPMKEFVDNLLVSFMVHPEYFREILEYYYGRVVVDDLIKIVEKQVNE